MHYRCLSHRRRTSKQISGVKDRAGATRACRTTLVAGDRRGGSNPRSPESVDARGSTGMTAGVKTGIRIGFARRASPCLEAGLMICFAQHPSAHTTANPNARHLHHELSLDDRSSLLDFRGSLTFGASQRLQPGTTLDIASPTPFPDHRQRPSLGSLHHGDCFSRSSLPFGRVAQDAHERFRCVEKSVAKFGRGRAFKCSDRSPGRP
jgi:hypothetical protein